MIIYERHSHHRIDGYTCELYSITLHKKKLTSVSSARRYCSFIISVYVLDPTSGVFPPEIQKYNLHYMSYISSNKNLIANT